MERKYSSNAEALKVAKRAIFLGWQAVGGPSGYGVFQDRGPQQDEETVWKQAYERGDYGGRDEREPVGKMNADYVFGRMMKLRFRVAGDTLTHPDHEPRSDYQAWCRKYPTFAALFDAAEASLKVPA